MPHVYSTEEAMRFIPHLVRELDSVLQVVDPTLLRGRLSKNEKTYRFSGMSAFCEETIQDAKYHMSAHEVYYVLEGEVSIEWKHVSDSKWSPNILKTDDVKRWIHIPPLHCLVLRNNVEKFLAVAFKSEQSTKGNGMKISASCCRAKLCDVRNECSRLEEERSSLISLRRTTNKGVQ